MFQTQIRDFNPKSMSNIVQRILEINAGEPIWLHQWPRLVHISKRSQIEPQPTTPKTRQSYCLSSKGTQNAKSLKPLSVAETEQGAKLPRRNKDNSEVHKRLARRSKQSASIKHKKQNPYTKHAQKSMINKISHDYLLLTLRHCRNKPTLTKTIIHEMKFLPPRLQQCQGKHLQLQPTENTKISTGKRSDGSKIKQKETTTYSRESNQTRRSPCHHHFLPLVLPAKTLKT